MGMKMKLNGMMVPQKCTLPHVSFIIRPNIFGNQ